MNNLTQRNQRTKIQWRFSGIFAATAADDNVDGNGDEHNSDIDTDGDWENWKRHTTV